MIEHKNMNEWWTKNSQNQFICLLFDLNFENICEGESKISGCWESTDMQLWKASQWVWWWAVNTHRLPLWKCYIRFHLIFQRENHRTSHNWTMNRALRCKFRQIVLSNRFHIITLTKALMMIQMNELMDKIK